MVFEIFRLKFEDEMERMDERERSLWEVRRCLRKNGLSRRDVLEDVGASRRQELNLKTRCEGLPLNG